MNGLHQIFIPLCTLAAACFIYALIRSLGSQLRLRRLPASPYCSVFTVPSPSRFAIMRCC